MGLGGGFGVGGGTKFFLVFYVRMNIFIRVLNLQNVSNCFINLMSCKQFSAAKIGFR